MTIPATSRHITLRERPAGMPTAKCWRLTEFPIKPAEAGEVTVRVIYVSVDPAMRGWLDDVDSYMPPVAIGETMRALGVGQVVHSNAEDYESGDYVSGIFGVQEYATVKTDSSMYKVDPKQAALSRYLGALGMPGMTAYFGLLDIGEPKSGDTLVVSGAAGAVGALVGQIAKVYGCRVVGVAGGQEKCEYLVKQLGFDDAVDYQSEADLGTALSTSCPDGINVFFDNVGGVILDAAVPLLARKARVVACGAISHYNDKDSMTAKVNYLPLIFNSIRLEGFVILDYVSRYPDAMVQMAEWLSTGQIIAKEDIYEGIENFPDVLPKLFLGQNFGKLILQVGPERS